LKPRKEDAVAAAAAGKEEEEEENLPVLAMYAHRSIVSHK
jgi:hypothetical protein